MSGNNVKKGVLNTRTTRTSISDKDRVYVDGFTVDYVGSFGSWDELAREVWGSRPSLDKSSRHFSFRYAALVSRVRASSELQAALLRKTGIVALEDITERGSREVAGVSSFGGLIGMLAEKRTRKGEGNQKIILDKAKELGLVI